MSTFELRIGSVQVKVVLELMLEVPAEMMIEKVTPESVAPYLNWLQPNYLTDDYIMRVAVQSFLLEADGKKILVDTCFGNDRDLPYPNVPTLHTDFLDQLGEHGFGPEEIDAVVCTHLHYDHVGWNTRLESDRWVPTFPNAEYLIVESEYEFWQEHDDFNIDLTDSIEPIVQSGLHRFVPADHRITDSLRLVPTPGHTPGHVSLMIESDQERALLSGDMIHHPVQIVEQHWSAVPDFDPDLAVATRQALLRNLAEDQTLLIGTHFADRPAGHVRHDDGKWAWVPLGQEG